MLELAYKPDQAEALKAELAGIANGFQRAAVRGLNKTAVAARADIVRKLAEEIGVKPSYLRRYSVKLRKANFRTMEAAIRITGKRVPLKALSARKALRGITYAMPGLKLAEHAFFAKMASGHVGVFRRQTVEKGRGRMRREIANRFLSNFRGRRGGDLVRRLPIVELFGPSAPAAAERIERLAAAVLKERMENDLQRNLETQAALVLADARKADLACDGASDTEGVE